MAALAQRVWVDACARQLSRLSDLKGAQPEAESYAENLPRAQFLKGTFSGGTRISDRAFFASATLQIAHGKNAAAPHGWRPLVQAGIFPNLHTKAALGNR